MLRAITLFETDEDGHWVVRLACGHRRHARHEPPWSDRSIVLTAEGRAGLIGAAVECSRCERLELPDVVEPYRKTAVFDHITVPSALLRRHSTKAGVWGQIDVLAGGLRYAIDPPRGQVFQLTEGERGIISPEMVHRVELDGPVQFQLTFLRQPAPERGLSEPTV